MTCASCGGALPQRAAFCPACGAATTDAEDAPTVYTPGGDVKVTSAATRFVTPRLTPPGTPPRGSASGRFRPGELLNGRYQIESLLGRGGMGEVYRAEDLTLEQTVALKFLPDSVKADAERLARFRTEVSVARQVSHPNVCRVYDIGEADGHIFLSMEYIDGEDLATLLRRIGRLSPDKAAEMARQLCAGLAAAHDRGVLHRDLKPANVMIDGRGRVRLADFGLAGAVAIDDGGLAGTPTYMAPELFAGQPTTIKSDIYALGLVLYEMFTGKAAFAGATVNEIVRQHREATPTSLTQVIGEIDPAVDRVIQRCLAKDPADRPSSALAVSAALPGGDPLAAALAAGETPSPELVAASGGVGALRPAVALGLLAGVIAGLLVITALSTRTQVIQYLPFERPPDVLVDTARNLLGRLGYTSVPGDVAWGYTPTDYLRHVAHTDQTPGKWEKLRAGQPPGVTFWYRESPQPMSSLNAVLGGRVTLTDPWPNVQGMVGVMLDLKGRLHFLQAVPERQVPPGAEASQPDWKRLLEQAGFDAARLTPATPIWTPPIYADARAAWTGVYPDRPDVSIRIEAAAANGRPVYFQIFEPWSAETIARGAASRSPSGLAVLAIAVALSVLIAAVLLARRNVRLGRGDQTGALRLAFSLCILHVLAGLLTAHYTFEPGRVLVTLAILIGRGLAVGALAYAIYMALEPDVRRRWPETLVGWSRVLAGRLSDPLVGRDILVGAALGIAINLLSQLARISPTWVGGPPTVAEPPAGFDGSIWHVLAALLNHIGATVLVATTLLLVYFFLTLLLRRRRLAIAAFAALLAAGVAAQHGATLPAVFAIGSVALVTYTVTRLGLLTLFVGELISTLLDLTPLTLDPRAWFFGLSMALLLEVAVLAVYGARNSLAGKPLLDGRLLD
jgi:predicted Ser/Thr protein kinase